MADASPQGGYNFYVVTESRVSFTLKATVSDKITCMRDSFETRYLPLLTLGYGATSLIYKGLATQHAIALECGTWETFDKARYEIRTWTSDQGREAELVDCPLLDGRLSDIVAAITKIRTGE
eukprot:2683960-Pyramimonas_sp.AAC.1